MLPPLRSTNRNKLINKVNRVCQYLPTSNLKATINLMFAVAQAVTETLGVPLQDKSAGAKSSSFVPPWKVRLDNKLACMRKIGFNAGKPGKKHCNH